MNRKLKAGAASRDISPHSSQHLQGYPHVERYSTGIHDPLFSSALYLSDGFTEVLFLAHDIISLPRSIAGDIRSRIEQAAGIDGNCVMITATHTHSGPITARRPLADMNPDPLKPEPDDEYLEHLKRMSVEAAVEARNRACSAEIGFGRAHVEGVGTNRHDPRGPADPEAPVLLVRESETGSPLALMMVYSMHPTVLHEDSRLVSADIPGAARSYLQRRLGADIPVLYHAGTAGNQSPRHVVNGQTFAEAERLGNLLGQAVEKALPREFHSRVVLGSAVEMVDLPRRNLPGVEEARSMLEARRRRFEELKAAGDPREARTAECDVFGAERRLLLAEAQAGGRLEPLFAGCLPAMAQVIRVGEWYFAGWPAEVFVEFGLELKRRCPQAFAITLANGTLCGYIATEEASAAGRYEAGTSLIMPAGGRILVETSERLIKQCALR